MTTRAAIYIRLSKDTEATTSPERQLEDCQRIARERGWDVIQVEDGDVDVSATKRRLNRPGLDRIRANYRDLDVVIFWKVDRLARSINDFSSLMEEAEAAGVALVSATEPLDLASPMGRMMAQIIAIFAEMEARTMGQRSAATTAHLRKTGRSAGGLLPYWLYRAPNPDGAGYVDAIDRERGEIVREAVARVLSGESAYAVCRDFTARELPTGRSGTRWGTESLLRMLRNPALIGRTVHRGEVLKGEDGLPVNHRPALLDGATWRRLQAELDRRGRDGERTRWDSDVLLSGLVRCGHCGQPMYPRSEKLKTGTTKRGYACSSRSNHAKCPGVYVSRDRLEDYVSRRFLDAVGRFDVVRPVDAPEEDHTDEIATVREALEDLEADRYERGMYRGASGAERFAERYRKLEDRLLALEEATAAPIGPQWESTGETFAAAWEREDVRGRRALLASGLEAVEVWKGQPGRKGLDGERVRLAWNEDPETAAVAADD